MGEPRLRVELAAEPASAGIARRAVAQACAGVGADLDSVMLCTSELVTNAVLHGTPPIELEVSVEAEVVRITVGDADPHAVARRRPVTDDTLSGRGLEIIDALAARWGTRSTPRGKAIWFEVSTG